MKNIFKISFLLRLVALALVVYGVFTLATTQSSISKKADEIEYLTTAVAEEKGENARLEEGIATMGTDQGTETIARDELGLVSAGEIVFKEVGN